MKLQYTQLIAFMTVLILSSVDLSAQEGIVGGRSVEEGKYPFMVGLIEAHEDNLLRAISCGATIVGDRWIMTAAHCLTDYDADGNIVSVVSPEEIEVLIGTYDLANPVNGYKRLEVEEIFINPDYQRILFETQSGLTGSIPENDIALMRLKENLDVPPVVLPKVDDDSWEIDGLPVRVMGWGQAKTNIHTRSSSLKEASIELINRDVCKEYEYYNELVSESMLCAGLNEPDQPTGGARGDSGGPLLVETGDGWLQLGIMSWGINYTEFERPGVFQKVNRHLDWIKEVIYKSTGVRSQALDDGVFLLRNGSVVTLSANEDLGRSSFKVFGMDGRLIWNAEQELEPGYQMDFQLPSSVKQYVFFVQTEKGFLTAVR